MPQPAPCGLRIAHDEHELPDGGTCPGKPWPEPYEPKHRRLGDYRPELDWTAEAAPRQGRHRRCVLARLTAAPLPPRPWLRLGWRDDDKEDPDDAD